MTTKYFRRRVVRSLFFGTGESECDTWKWRPGAVGVDFIPGSNLIIRADYENQNWANFMDFHSLTPRGFTISVGYDFKRHPQ